MNWLIIIAVLLVIAGGFAWIKPSKREVRQAQWRQAAIQNKLEIKMIQFLPDAKETGIHSTPSGVRYRWINPQKKITEEVLIWSITREKGWYNQGLPEGWYWEFPIRPHDAPAADIQQAAINAINNLPLLESSVININVSTLGGAVIWDEANQAFDAKQLADYLQKLGIA